MNINKIAFIPHPTRGSEIINIFESLGFRNPMNYNGTSSDKYLNHAAYVGGCDGAEDCIIIDNIDYLERVGYKICTLEEWEELNKCEYSNMKTAEYQYLQILKEILDYGEWKEAARPGMPRTKEVFFRTMPFDLDEG